MEKRSAIESLMLFDTIVNEMYTCLNNIIRILLLRILNYWQLKIDE